MKLTPKQKAFADYYIECGNASEAARRAGYSANGVNSHAARLMANGRILAYMQERLADQDAERVATADEVMRFYTSVMRGEVTDAFGLDPGLADRLKAADSLMKRYAVCEKTGEKDDPLLKYLEEMRNA